MNKAMLHPIWDMMRQRTGILLRCVEALPADKLDSHPIAGMRTPKELVVHAAGFMRLVPDAVLNGAVGNVDEKAVVAGIGSKDQLATFVMECWTAADQATAKVTDAQLGALVSTPWGGSYPGFVMYSILQDEFLHHRGQLYAFVRALGAEPPMNWDFEHNAEEFRPKGHPSGV